MKKIILFLVLAFVLASCDESGDKKINVSDKVPSVDETKKKELEAKEKELELKEKELQKQKEQQKENELSEREKQLAEKDRELAEKERSIEEQRNKPVTPPPTRNKPNYSGVPGSYPQGSTRYLVYEDIYGKTKWQLRVMRNEIFARHGYIFQSNDLRNHFGSKSWYYPQYYDVTGMLSEVEKYNVNFIKSYE